MQEKITNYKELMVWKKSMDVVTAVYQLTGLFPKTEVYGLAGQMKRSAMSIPSNIAEGSRRGSRKDYRQFIIIAFGLDAELETQIEMAKRPSFCTQENCVKIDGLLNEVMRMLNVMIGNLSATHYSLQTTH